MPVYQLGRILNQNLTSYAFPLNTAPLLKFNTAISEDNKLGHNCTKCN